MARQLRDYQQEAVHAVYDEWTRVHRTAVVMATGLGKTDVIAKVATDHVRAGGRPLILAHRSELLDQITARCGMHAPDIPIGRIQAARNETRRKITVAMSSTLANAKRQQLMLPPTMVIVDECHHAPAAGYMKILEWAGCFADTPALGVTATMTRAGKRGTQLGDVWESVAFQRDILWAIDNGWLVRPRGRTVALDHLDLTTAKVSKGDYQDGDLGEMVAQDVDQIVKAWQEHAPDRITAGFVPNIASATALRDEFLAQGVPSEMVLGDTPLDVRGDAAKGTGIYGRLARGDTRVMVGVGVPTEGFDCPSISCILMARPTKLPGLYTQIVGRGLRLSPGKTDCLVLDVVGVSRHQKLVQLIDLTPSAEYVKEELPCEECGGYLTAPSDRAPDPCSCEPEPAEPIERDPDGGRVRLPGPATYVDVDLLSRSRLPWLTTKGGLRFLVVGDRYVSLLPEPDGSWSAGHCIAQLGRPYDGHSIVQFTSEQEAIECAESWALDYDPDAARAVSPWRTRARVMDRARRLGIAGAEAMTKDRAGAEITVTMASRRLD